MWRENFRHSTFRPGQERALDDIHACLEGGEKFVVADIPTGVGKSDIAMALAKTCGSAYIATSQNTLVDQYLKEFSSDSKFWHIKGRSNYTCPTFGNCDKGAKVECEDYAKGTERPCHYKTNREIASSSSVALTNLTYFALGIDPRRENSPWKKRSLAVIDEAHNLSSEVLNLTFIEISNKHLAGMFASKRIHDFLKDGPVDTESIAFWSFIEYMNKYIKFSEVNYSKMSESERISHEKIKEDIDAMVVKIKWFESSYDEGVEWIADVITEGKLVKLMLRPLDSSYFAQKIFFTNQADQYLLQSATIINPERYAKDLGIDSFGLVEAESPFKLFKTRPLFCMNTGKMGSKDVQGTLPDIARDVSRIIESYKGKKGLVHTVNYKTIHSYLKEVLKDNPRCLFLDKGNKLELLKKHEESDDTVIFSPSLTEGFDGKDDLVRFQIICKIPYAGLGDRRIKIKLERDPSWYREEALKTVVQMVGRGVRSETDYCDNYMLDSGFGFFCKQSSPPPSFMNTVIFSKDITEKRLARRP